MRNRVEYNKKIDKISRINFHNDLESIKYFTLPIDYQGKATRQEIEAQLVEWQTYDKSIQNLNSTDSKSVKGFLSRLRIKKQLSKKKQPNTVRETLRLMLGLMDLMDLDEIIPEYMDEFMKYEEDFYSQFEDIYDYRTREALPFSKYIDNDHYID